MNGGEEWRIEGKENKRRGTENWRITKRERALSGS